MSIIISGRYFYISLWGSSNFFLSTQCLKLKHSSLYFKQLLNSCSCTARHEIQVQLQLLSRLKLQLHLDLHVKLHSLAMMRKEVQLTHKIRRTYRIGALCRSWVCVWNAWMQAFEVGASRRARRAPWHRSSESAPASRLSFISASLGYERVKKKIRK